MKTQKKRRKQSKTDYKKRLNLLKSGAPRLVFRRTNACFKIQYVESKEAQDKVIFGLDSKILLKYGWPNEFKGSLKSIPAAYLTGKKMLKDKLKQPIVDFGMIRMIHKTKTYGFLKGLIDSGIKIECKEEAFPEKERIEGKNLKSDFSSKFKEIKLKLEKAQDVALSKKEVKA